MSRDPLGFVVSSNLQFGMGGRPLNFTDQMGLWPTCGQCPWNPEKDCPCCNVWKEKSEYLRDAYVRNFKDYDSKEHQDAAARVFVALAGTKLRCEDGFYLYCGATLPDKPKEIVILVTNPDCKLRNSLCPGCEGIIDHELGHSLCLQIQLAGGATQAEAEASCGHSTPWHQPDGGNTTVCGRLYQRLIYNPKEGAETMKVLREKCGATRL